MSKDPKKNPDPEKDPQACSDPIREPEKDPEKDPKPQPQTDSADPDDDSEPELDPEPEPEPDPDPDPVPESAAELTALRAELQAANAKLAAYKVGVPPDAVDDAVVLALHDLQQAGTEITPEALDGAITAVLQRHSDWLRAKTPPAPAKAGAPQKERKTTDKTLPSGTVIF